VKGDYSFDPALTFAYPEGAVTSQTKPDTDDADAGRKRARSVTVTYKAVAEPIPIAASDFDLTLHVPRPVPGGSPARTFYTGTFGGSVDWTAAEPDDGPVDGGPVDGGPVDGGPVDGLFLAGAAYSAAVSLYPGPGYVFPGGSIPVIHSGALSSPVPFAAGSGGTAAGVLRFPETTGVPEVVAVDEFDLTYKIPAPVWGGTPVAYLSAPQYAGNVTWAPPHSGLFEEGTAYTATVALTAALGFTFTGVGANAFGHDGKDAAKSPHPANAAGSGTVRIVFPATTEEKAAVVDDLDLTGKILAPAAEGIPVAYFFPPLSPQYTGNVAWSTGGIPHNGLFQEGMAYTATVTLTAASGFTLTGVKENAFTHNGTANVTNAADPETVIIVFSAPGGGEGTVEFPW
jgi:hypothetical protein